MCQHDLRARCTLRLAYSPAEAINDSHPGYGWTQCEGEQKAEIRNGDVIWCPPRHKHAYTTYGGRWRTRLVSTQLYSHPCAN